MQRDTASDEVKRIFCVKSKWLRVTSVLVLVNYLCDAFLFTLMTFAIIYDLSTYPALDCLRNCLARGKELKPSEELEPTPRASCFCPFVGGWFSPKTVFTASGFKIFFIGRFIAWARTVWSSKQPPVKCLLCT